MKEFYVTYPVIKLPTLLTEFTTPIINLFRDIIEEEQHGQERANYGRFLLQQLSEELQATHGRGFSIENLTNMRKFYLAYQQNLENEKSYTLCTELPNFYPNLGWSHYRILMRIENSDIRKFYEIEANDNCWSSRVLKRQVDSLLYERLAMSKDKNALRQLTEKGQVIDKPEDAIKNPLVLEFLKLPTSKVFEERDLETALITHMQEFLLELGKGFALIGRQKAMIVNGQHYYPDLVFYHTILKCYVIIEIKVNEIKHGDLGQMQFYVNYYDDVCRAKDDNPTIGLLLGTAKDDAVVKYTLGKNNQNIFASKYMLYLPSEKELENELKKERELIEQNLNQQDNE